MACFMPYLRVLLRIWLLGERLGVGAVSQRIGAQLPYAIFQPWLLKNQRFQTLFFYYRDHLK